jgi:zinc transport system substrate-binding protein
MGIKRGGLSVAVVLMMLACFCAGCSNTSHDGGTERKRSIVTSDTLLSGIIASLLPPYRYSVEAILPPGQCPGHYDVKLSDIAKIKKAVLTVSFNDMPSVDKGATDGGARLLVNPAGRNWMAPDSYVYGVRLLADELIQRFPEDKAEIMRRSTYTIEKVQREANLLVKKIKDAGIFGKPVLASSMQKEPVEWMGFRVVAEYGRQEAMSVREIIRLTETGKTQRVIMVVDNLQSGPNAGKGIAETIGAPHIVLTNFPSEKGYLATLEENIAAVLAAARR